MAIDRDNLKEIINGSFGQLLDSGAIEALTDLIDINWDAIQESVSEPIESLQFDTEYVPTEHSTGLLHWDDEAGTLELGLTGNEVKLQLGFENLVKGKNITGTNETNGKIAYISGASGANPEFSFADADTITTASAIGWFTEDINDNGNGYVTTEGLVRDIDTSGCDEGDILWLSSTPGEFTNIRPTAPVFNVVVGICLRSHENEGVIFARVDIVPRLRGLSDVYSPTEPNDGETLYWSDTNKRFQILPRVRYIEGTNLIQLGDIDGGNYLEINETGEVRLYGEATQWDDFSVPLNRSRQGVNSKPDYDTTNLGLLFPQNDTTEEVQFVAQMSHKKELGTNIHLHIHYIQSVATQPTFTVEFKFYNNGATVPTSWTTINTSDVGGSKGVFPYTSGSIMQIATFPAIAPPVDEDVSANLDVRVYRNDNDVTGDVLGKYIDFHYAIDSLGSNEEFVKY